LKRLLFRRKGNFFWVPKPRFNLHSVQYTLAQTLREVAADFETG